MTGDNDLPWRHLLPIPSVEVDLHDMSKPLIVGIEVSSALVSHVSIQRLTWLLVTLLVRSTKHVVAEIVIDCPDTALLPTVDPSSPDGHPSLLDALRRTAGSFGPEASAVSTRPGSFPHDVLLRVGVSASTMDADRAPGHVLYVSASGWAGAISPSAEELLPLELSQVNPVGPYVAACLAAGEVFMLARMTRAPSRTLALNAWTLTHSDQAASAVQGGPELHAVELDYVLAGVGAVGSALLLTLWACEPVSGLIRAADDDAQGVGLTNLNRCLPFHFEDLDTPKAVAAAARLPSRHGLSIDPVAGAAENLVDGQAHLICAVDTPESRQSLQDRYPRSAIQASTEGLRLEMLRVDPTNRTACLRCFNPSRNTTSDEAVRAGVAGMSAGEIAEHAMRVGVDPAEVTDWAEVGGCGKVGEALLRELRPSIGEPAAFSVGAVSVLAGVLLATQAIKDTVRRSDSVAATKNGVPLDGELSRFVLNLYSPSTMSGVRRYRRDASCPACGGVRAEIWARRWSG